MSYNVSGLTDFVNEQNLPLLSKSILGGDFLRSFNIQTGIKKSSALNILDVDLTIQDGSSCGFSVPSGSSDTFSQRIIDVSPLKVNKEFCPKELNAKWMGYEVITAANGQELPFEEYFVDQIAQKIQSQIGFNFWQGQMTTGSTYQDFPGLLSISGTTQLTGVTTGMSSYDAILYVYNQIDASVIDEAEIFVGMDTYRTFIQNVLSKNLYQVNADEGNNTFILPGTNMRINGINYLNGTKKIVATKPSNVYYGTDLESDEDQFDLFYSNDSRLFKLVVEWKSGVQILFPDQFYVATII